MEIKINTKEKFTVITPIVPHLYDNLAEELNKTCLNYLNADTKNVILNLQSITAIDEGAAKGIADLQNEFYDNSASFVLCEMKPQLEEILDKYEILDVLNVTPTESEAWDIVQMEEIERELMDGEDL
ncbi:MAG: STAS domain-containing protein [Chitinophagaceae bacterium]